MVCNGFNLDIKGLQIILEIYRIQDLQQWDFTYDMNEE
jgi:hypothetical protein